MRTLTSSCSKAIIDKNRDKGFSCFKDLSLSRAEVCLLPSKKLVRIQFLNLLSAQYKRLQPAFSSSSVSPGSRPQVDLETAEAQPEGENPSQAVHVKFQLQKECAFGEHFFIVGDHSMLGLWDPESAIPLNWSEGHVWTVELDIPVGISIQFKFILKTRTGNLLWQPGPDRIFKSWETENMITVCEDWEGAEYQKVIEEQPLANQDGPLLDSEVTPPEEELVSDSGSITSPVKEPSKALSEEVVTGNSAPSMEKPLAIVADNISHPAEDFIANANNGVLGEKRTNNPIAETLAVSNKNVLVADDVGNISRAETLPNPATPDVEGTLVSHEGSPVLVPGLTPLATVSTEEVTLEEDGKKNSTSGASVEVNEAKYHNEPELVEKQENEDEPREAKTITPPKDEEEQLDNRHIQKPRIAREEQPDKEEAFQSDVLQSDVQWGRKTLRKLLNCLGFP